jgi:outer membrane biogenesis lipoprotein LolB
LTRRELFILMRPLSPSMKKLLPVVLLLLTGCAALTRSSRPLISANPQQIHAQAADNYRRLQSFRGNGRLIIDSPEVQLAAAATVLTQQPDSMFIKVEATFGVDAGFFFADRKRFESYSPFENTYFFGDVNHMEQLLLFRMKVNYDEMLSGITGAMLPAFDSTFVMTVDEGSYRFEGRREAWRVTYWIDPKHGGVIKAEQHDSTGALYSRQTFRRFHKTNGIWLPQWLQLDRPGARERFTIFYNRVTVNAKIAPADFSLRVPASAARIDLSAPIVEPEVPHSQPQDQQP